jgi:hypothetical protein
MVYSIMVRSEVADLLVYTVVTSLLAVGRAVSLPTEFTEITVHIDNVIHPQARHPIQI